MSPITKITIENFQSHKKTEITPAPSGQLTVLTGPSDSGKTAIIRALRWLLYNIPQGTDFIRAGASFTRVTAEYASGHKVIRERSRRGYNRYIVINPAGERQVYEGFGNNVPLEVQLVTGVRPVHIADIDFNINISEQLDGPFLGKSVSAGLRAKVLGHLAGTEEIDYAAKTLATDLYRKRQEEKQLAAMVRDFDEKIKSYDYLEPLKNSIDAVNEALAALKNDIALYEQLEQLAAGIRETRALASEKRRVVEELRTRLAEIEPLMDIADRDSLVLGMLEKIHTGLSETQSGIIKAQRVLADTSGAGAASELLARVEKDSEFRSRCCKLAKKLNTCRASRRQAEAVLDATKFCRMVEDLIEDTVNTYNKLCRLIDVRDHLAEVWNCLDKTYSLLEFLTICFDATGKQPKAEKLLETTSRDVVTVAQLTSLHEKILINRRKMALAYQDLQNTAQVDEIIPLIRDTEHNANLFSRLKKYFADITATAQKARKTGTIAKEFTGKVQQAQQKYINLLTRLGICPTCGSDIIPEKLREVV